MKNIFKTFFIVCTLILMSVTAAAKVFPAVDTDDFAGKSYAIVAHDPEVTPETAIKMNAVALTENYVTGQQLDYYYLADGGSYYVYHGDGTPWFKLDYTAEFSK